MAEALPSLPKIDKSTVVSVIVAVVILVLLYMGYEYFVDKKPAGALSADEYGKLADADKTTYKKGSDGWYVKA